MKPRGKKCDEGVVVASALSLPRSHKHSHFPHPGPRSRAAVVSRSAVDGQPVSSLQPSLFNYYPPPPLHSLSTALYTRLSFIRRLPSCWDTNVPTTSATTCTTHRSKLTDTATFMMAAHKSVNRADMGMGTSSSKAEMNLVGTSKTETLNSDSATRDTISSPVVNP